MTKRFALFISTGLAAAVVAVVAVLIWQAGVLATPSAAEASGGASGPGPAPSDDVARLQAMNAALQEREQVFQQRIAEANRLLASMSSQTGQGGQPGPQGSVKPQATPTATAAPSPASEQPAAPGEMLTQAEAIEIALAYAGDGKVREVELETRRGVTAYKVKVNRTEVFVDAFTGEVIIPSGRHGRGSGHDDDEDED